jgi:hypothetical protein
MKNVKERIIDDIIFNKINYAAEHNNFDFAAVEGKKVKIKLINDKIIQGTIHIHVDFLTDKKIIEINNQFYETFQIKDLYT